MSEHFKEFWSSALTIPSFFRQCAFMLHNANQQLLPQDWSLGVELKGSALVPVFIFLVRRHNLLLFGAGVLLLIFIPTGSHYVSFVLGVFAAKYYYSTIQPGMRRLTFASKCGILAFGVLLYQTRFLTNRLWEDSRIADHFAWCICSVGCVIIITTSLGSNRIQAALSHGLFVFLGRISYSVYLLQIIVLLCVLPPLTRGLNIIGVQNMFILMPLTFFMSISVTVLTACLTYRIVEVPSMALGRWMSSIIQNRFPHRNIRPKIQKKAT